MISLFTFVGIVSLVSIIALLASWRAHANPGKLLTQILITGWAMMIGLNSYVKYDNGFQDIFFAFGVGGALAFFTLRGLLVGAGIAAFLGGCGGLIVGFLVCTFLGFIICPLIWIGSVLFVLWIFIKSKVDSKNNDTSESPANSGPKADIYIPPSCPVPSTPKQDLTNSAKPVEYEKEKELDPTVCPKCLHRKCRCKHDQKEDKNYIAVVLSGDVGKDSFLMDSLCNEDSLKRVTSETRLAGSDAFHFESALEQETNGCYLVSYSLDCRVNVNGLPVIGRSRVYEGDGISLSQDGQRSIHLIIIERILSL